MSSSRLFSTGPGGPLIGALVFNTWFGIVGIDWGRRGWRRRLPRP